MISSSRSTNSGNISKFGEGSCRRGKFSIDLRTYQVQHNSERLAFNNLANLTKDFVEHFPHEIMCFKIK